MKKKNKSREMNFKNFEKKLDALILLGCVENLSGEDKLKILTHGIGLREAARILGKGHSNLAKSIKKKKKNE